MSDLPPSSRPPAVRLMRHLGLEPDPWQLQVLESGHPRLLLNCCRQAGKSTVVAVLALAEAVFTLDTLVLMIAPCHRQSQELFRKLVDYFHDIGAPLLQRCNSEELLLANGSRVVPLPCREETIRGYSGVSRLIIDEASRVPDDIYRTVRPMMAVSESRLACLSTPHGRRGFFHKEWTTGGDDWLRIEVPAARVGRIKPKFLEEERRALGESYFRQEYCCSFEALEGLVYTDFARCAVPGPAPAGKPVGGLDFGVRNPCAAVWGVLDRDDVLWLTGEHYARGQTLADLKGRLPDEVMWYCDPSGARERLELRAANLKVQPGINDVRLGIQAVRARLESGRLRVVQGTCPNLLYEAGLYRYEDGGGRKSETPLGEQDHALDALRYLVSRLDERHMVKGRRRAPSPAGAPSAPAQSAVVPAPPDPDARRGQSLRDWWGNDNLYSPLG
jgi:hypothetical protein